MMEMQIWPSSELAVVVVEKAVVAGVSDRKASGFAFDSDSG